MREPAGARARRTPTGKGHDEEDVDDGKVDSVVLQRREREERGQTGGGMAEEVREMRDKFYIV